MWIIRGFLLVLFALAWLALSPAARAVSPPPDGGYPGQNTAEGENALLNLTTGFFNTAIGFEALDSLTTGFHNTATGDLALAFNTTGNGNTANGADALGFNATGSDNTANGFEALYSNTTGIQNTANGVEALFSNTTASDNTANGSFALFSNTTGSSNIALGASAGINRTTGSNNIDIGNAGAAGKSNVIRIGTNGTQKNAYIAGISGVTVAGGVGVIIDSTGHLGTVVSSERFKDEIKPMDKASEAILALKPVTFRYKHELDPDGIPQFGLVAEQVEKVNPDLVARDEEGKPYTVRYEAVNAMLLNEFLKEHRKVEEQGRKDQELEATIAQLKSTVAQQQKDFQSTVAKLQKDFQLTAAQQQKEIKALTTSLKEHAAQIQKVSRLRRVEVSKSGPRVVASNQ
jgi:hypothetical protein